MMWFRLQGISGRSEDVNPFTGKFRERIESDCLLRGTGKMIDWRPVAGKAKRHAAEHWRHLAPIRDRGDVARKEKLPAGARDRLRGMWRDRPGR